MSFLVNHTMPTLPRIGREMRTGVIKKPSVFVVAKIAKALDISVDNLLS